MNKNEFLDAGEIAFAPDLQDAAEASDASVIPDEEAIGTYPEEVGESLPEDIGECAEQFNDNCDGGDDAKKSDEKEEYRRLIKTRFKDFYNEDAQKLINRRFRKYKALEERFDETENQLAEANRELEELKASFDAELERVAKETEERVLNSVRLRQMRPDENGIARKQVFSKSQISSLTKSERANIAKRAADGEKIVF